jgi:hypothetical protein
MKTIHLLKITTGLLAFFILIGLVLVITKLSENASKRKPVLPKTTTFSLPFPEDINQTLPCGDFLCLMTEGHPKGRRLIIVDPQSGHITHIVQFPEKKDQP